MFAARYILSKSVFIKLRRYVQGCGNENCVDAIRCVPTGCHIYCGTLGIALAIRVVGESVLVELQNNEHYSTNNSTRSQLYIVISV